MDHSQSETELIARAKRLDADAWSAIYSQHQAVIYRYVRARVDADEVAEDLTAAVFLGAIEGIARYREQGRPLLAWLYRIARNSVADHQRKSAVRGRLRVWMPAWKRGRLENPMDAVEPSSGRDDPGATVERLDLRRAIDELPDAQREVVILRHRVGLSTAEIAAVMGKRATAVYSLEARALLSLRTELTDPKEISSPTDENAHVRAINSQMKPVDTP